MSFQWFYITTVDYTSLLHTDHSTTYLNILGGFSNI